MKKDDRVHLKGTETRGTITKVSSAGIVHIRWDEDSRCQFSLALASTALEIVTGDDAAMRHMWTDGVCDVCNEVQTVKNDKGPCAGCDCMDCSIAGEATH